MQNNREKKWSVCFENNGHLRTFQSETCSVSKLPRQVAIKWIELQFAHIYIVFVYTICGVFSNTFISLIE